MGAEILRKDLEAARPKNTRGAYHRHLDMLPGEDLG
jgi:hypothetical protein